jgi:hypothetical protein
VTPEVERVADLRDHRRVLDRRWCAEEAVAGVARTEWSQHAAREDRRCSDAEDGAPLAEERRTTGGSGAERAELVADLELQRVVVLVHGDDERVRQQRHLEPRHLPALAHVGHLVGDRDDALRDLRLAELTLVGTVDALLAGGGADQRTGEGEDGKADDDGEPPHGPCPTRGPRTVG